MSRGADGELVAFCRKQRLMLSILSRRVGLSMRILTFPSSFPRGTHRLFLR